MDMKLSIVIPVFNMEHTLNECVESILWQSFQDFELILVDDGSTDRTPSICDEWARKNMRVIVIHQPNGGLSNARNKGIESSRGQYITFVDADDKIKSDTYAQLMDIVKSYPEYDLLEYPVIERYGNRKRQHLLTFAPQTYHDMNTYWLECRVYEHAYAWNKIYKRTLFNDIRFPEQCIFEDVYTLPNILSKCRVVATTDKGLYYYNWNHYGITARANGKELFNLLQIHISIWYKLYRQRERFRYNIMRDYYACLLNIQFDVYEFTGESPILPYAPYTGNCKLNLLRLMGMKKICQLNKLLHQIIKWRK